MGFWTIYMGLYGGGTGTLAVTGADLHYTIPASKNEYTVPANKLEYTVPD